MHSKALIVALLMSAAPLPALAQALPLPAAQAGDGAEDAKLKRLFHDSDERDIRLHPLDAIRRGDMRFADRFGEPLTDRAEAQEKRNVETDLRALARIDRGKLTPVDQIAYDVFLHERRLDLRAFAPEIAAVRRALPINHFGGLHTSYPDFASGKGAAPFRTVEDYENNLRRNAAMRRCTTGSSRGFAAAWRGASCIPGSS